MGEKVTRRATSLGGFPIHARPPEEVGPFGESETCKCAKASQWSLTGPGAAAWFRARPVDAQRAIPTQEFLYAAGRRHFGGEEYLATTCPACGAADANTQHAHLCHSAGVEVNQTSRWST